MRYRARRLSAANLGLWLFVLAASFAGEAKAAQFLYVVSQDDSAVEVIDTSTDALVATLPVTKGPATIAAAPNGRKLYITHPDAGKLGRYPEGVVIAPDGSKVYVANWASGDISVLNGETGQELRRIKASSGARASAIVPAG